MNKWIYDCFSAVTLTLASISSSFAKVEGDTIVLGAAVFFDW